MSMKVREQDAHKQRLLQTGQIFKTDWRSHMAQSNKSLESSGGCVAVMFDYPFMVGGCAPPIQFGPLYVFRFDIGPILTEELEHSGVHFFSGRFVQAER